jgi:UDPglucose 6-dehydrogenase
MNIAVFGNGLQSRVCSALLASVGNKVFVEDSTLDTDFCGASQREPNLDALYSSQLEANRIKPLSKFNHTLLEFIILAEVDPSTIYQNYQQLIDKAVTSECIFIILTPAEIGEADKLSAELSQGKTEAFVCSLPLLVREGRAIDDFSRPESLIVGCDDMLLEQIKALFHPFNRVKDVIKHVSSREAEFSCFASHAMLATRLSFMNEMASLAERSQVDIETVRECIGMDPRIGKDYLYPGCGFGGSALTTNVEKVASQLRQRHDDLGLLDIVVEINQRQKDLLFRKIWKFFKTDIKGKTVAIWGASFKPGSASISGAASVELIKALLAHSAKVVVYDPLAAEVLNSLFSNNQNFSTVADQYDACINANVLAICTEWKEFWSPDLDLLAAKLEHKAIFDGRNILEPEMVNQHQLHYFAIGRGESL